MDVSIIMPIYNPNENLLHSISEKLKRQKFDGKIEVLRINKGWGLAKTLNYGIKNSKYDIVVSLHQDCVPLTDDWLAKLVAPLKDENVVACVSDVKDSESDKIYTPALDEKGCAYIKSVLEHVGYFNEDIFLNSGEDADMYYKLLRVGKIEYPHSIVEHIHPGYLKAEGYKKPQNANTWGCLFRIYGFSLPGWWRGVLSANPFNWNYCYWFWRGFLLKRQDYKR